jgi:hypothetical protein
VTTPPLDPTRPATTTRPAHGARTRDAGGAARSTPRWWPPAYGFAPGSKAREIGPETGRRHAAAAGAGEMKTTSKVRVMTRTRANVRVPGTGWPEFRCIGTISA